MKKNFQGIFFALIALITIIACSTGEGNDENSNSSSSAKLEVPVISPSAGDYSEGYKLITLSCENKNSEIYYTTDGTDPSDTSSRYSAPFTILGSKTVKAIAYSDGKTSSIVTAVFNLNAGKSASQLGVIKGSITLASNLSDDVKAELASSEIYIYSSDLPGVVKHGKIGESFYIDGLDTAKSYSFYFSNKEPGVAIEARSVQRDENGKPVVSAHANVKPEEGNGADLGEVPLKQTGTITGVAKKIGEDGTEETDHAGITVFIPGTSYSAFTAKDGSFSMTTVPQGMYTIRAMYAGYTFSEQENILLSSVGDEIPVTDIETPFEVIYAKGTVKGTVLLGDRTSGFTGIDVVLTDASNAHSYTAATSATGSWLINDVVPGTYSVEFHKDGYVDQTVNDILVSGAKITTVSRIVLKEDGGSISGKAFVAKSPLAGISIIAERNADDTEAARTYYALSNTNGSFTFDSVAPGLYTVTAVYPGYKSVSQANVHVSIGEKIELADFMISEETTYSLTGTCVLEGISTGFEGTNVILQSTTDSKKTKSTTTNVEGVYIFSDLDAGSYLLTFSRSGFITNSSLTVEVGAKSIAVAESVALKSSAGSVSGTVRLESAETNEGISILVTNENDNTVSYNTVTDTNGHYAIAGITPGTYRVQATKSGYNTGISDPFAVSSGITSTPSDMLLSISLRALYGTVTLEGRTDFSGVRITATKTTSTTEIYSALSNKYGVYALSGMTPGEYILSYSYESYRSYTSSSVSLSNDSSLKLDDVELKKATGKISGIVNLEGCVDHSGITVSVVGTDYTYITESNGAYEFTVPSGNYPGGVRFEREDFQLTAKAETIPVLTDSTYGVLTVEMKATANTLKGITTLAGTDDASGIKVTVDGLDDKTYSATTNKEGNWQLDHIPLGYQTVRFSKTNVPDVTSEVQVVASDYIDLGSLEMIPDSATLKGYVFLDGMSDNANISVTVTTKDKDDIVVRTTSDGAFEATNILASGNHTVTFSKEGWNSQSLTIDDFEPLEERTIGTNREYVLTDTTAPAWGNSPVTINSGANYANNTKLHIDLSLVEKGSGIEKMSVQITRTADGITSALYPSSYNWQNYQIGFDFDLEELPDQYVGNGTYRLYITLKDKSGNVSETAEKAITITDLVTSLSGVLTGDKLHLTEENSPYLVEADCLVSEGQTLVIDPGVEIRFAAPYSISVSGSIEARGTAEKKILFTSDCVNQEHTYTTTEWGEYQDSDGNYQWGEHEVTKTEGTTVYWNGIAINGGSVSTENTYNYVSGNIMEYCEFEYANTPLTIKAGAYINKCHFHDCTTAISIGYSTVLINNLFENGITVVTNSDSGIQKLFIINNLIKQYAHFYKWYGINFEVRNNTFEDTAIDIATFYGWDFGNTFAYNVFTNSSIRIDCKASEFLATFSDNNFVDCNSPIITAHGEYVSNYTYNFTHNYWDAAQTDELNNKGSLANISFFSDYYDDFKLSRIDYSKWATEPFENCGYSETGFVAFDYAVNGYDFGSDSGYYPESTDTHLNIELTPQYYENPITQMRLAQSYEELKKAAWQSYSTNTTFTVNKSKLVNGAATIYVQIKDSVGNASSAVVHNIPYDTPVCSFSIEDGAVFGSGTKKQEVKYSATDLCNITSGTFSLDGGKINSWSGSNWGTNFSNSYTLPLGYMAAGTHTLTMTATDSAGNTGETTISFTINRTFNESDVANISYDTTTGQFIKDAGTVHLWHLDNDGSENIGTAAITEYTHTNGGFEGSASRLNGSVPLDISSNAFTVEFWTRGSSRIVFAKESTLEVYNRYDSATEYNHIMQHSYITTDGVSNSRCYADARIRGDDQWHYWAYVYGSTYSAVYCDGVCVSYQDGFTHTLNTNNNNLSISSSGIIDEIRISNSARSADEINSYYKTAKPILDANTGSLEAIVY
ncbi:carboxypeptidase regulatory-like domain-containing protein [uncultured Treponema sp.]|uniref:carboxypeptidase regulatory-like domain-containing protein n=1 Tax=uncultured Treponema sp. TaxID=162155 RepID=UPI0025CF3F6F|nr:carboxypeptidase regulatory-like domain-containing protein [uncultured Treponema sp.]